MKISYFKIKFQKYKNIFTEIFQNLFKVLKTFETKRLSSDYHVFDFDPVYCTKINSYELRFC